ncbi:MAG: ABC transporter ATP-binding protein [Planctomycetaceae bacterium]
MNTHTSTPRLWTRLVPHQLWRKLPGVRVLFWSAGGAVSLFLLILTLTLGVDLLSHQGRLRITEAELPEFREFVAGISVPQLSNDGTTGGVSLTETGLLPTVWTSRNKPWGSMIERPWRTWSALQSNNGALAGVSLLLLLIGGLRVLSYSQLKLAATTFAASPVGQLRSAIHRQALRLGTSHVDGPRESEATKLFLQGVAAIDRNLSNWARNSVHDILAAVLFLMIALIADWKLTLECLFPAFAACWIMRYAAIQARAKRELVIAQTESNLRVLAEGLESSRLIRGYGMEKFEQDRFDHHLNRYQADLQRADVGETLSLRLSRLLAVFCLTVVLFLIGSRVLSVTSPLPLGRGWLIFLSLVGLVTVSVSAIRTMKIRQSIIYEVDRVYRYLATIPEVGQAVGAKFLEPLSESIRFESVDYRTQGKHLLQGIDLTIAAGTRTAIVSHSIEEARALVYLLPRFIEPTSGKILFDNQDTNDGTLESLRAEAIFVSGSDPFLTGTILENLTCGQSEYSSHDAVEAAKLTHVHKFVSSLPNKYDTMLGEHGETLEPGVAFRLHLARAALRSPALLIIEEPQAPLDADSKALIDDTYQRLSADRTLLFLPRRMSTLRFCQQVIYLQEGKVNAIGPQAELVKQHEGYRHWEYIHFSPLSRRLI